MTDRPLLGLRVLEISSGPMAAIGRQLAELGASVEQCVPPGDEPGLIQAVERLGKTVSTFDPKDENALAGLRARLAETDILIIDTENAPAPDPLELHRQYPGLVILTLSPFGLTGRCKDWKLTEPVAHALSGELSRSGIPDREPLLPPDGIGWGCAASQAVYVTLLSVWNRMRNGAGNLIDFSVFEGASLTLDPGYGIAGSAAAGVPLHKMPRGRPEGRQRYPILPCQDGYVRICVLAKRQWRALFEYMGQPEQFSDDQFNLLHVRFNDPDLLPAITAFFADKTGDELEAEGEKRGIPIARVYRFEEAIHSPQISARHMFEPREILPGLIALTPNGSMEIDGQRMNAQTPVSPSERLGPLSDLPKSNRPFEGLRVLDLGVIVVGAETGRLFADQGAEVLKVENSGFPDGMRQSRGKERVSQTFGAGHRNKKGLGLNLRSAEGQQLFRRLVEQADIVLTNFKAGTLESLGFGYDVLRTINPEIIWVDSAAFGPTGPWARRLGYGPLVRASIGLSDLWRYKGEPLGFGDALTVHPDHLASRIGAIGGVSLLIRRLRTGRGGQVSVSQAETALNSLGARAAQADLRSRGLDAPMKGEKDTPWDVFPAKGDDEWCVVTVRNETEWLALCRVMGREELSSHPSLSTPEGRAENAVRIEEALTLWLADYAPMDAAAKLQAAGIPAGALLRVSEIPDFPGFSDRNLFRTVSHPEIADAFIQENAPSRMTSIPEPDIRPAPLMGQHTREIMRDWLDMPETEIDDYIARGDLEALQG